MLRFPSLMAGIYLDSSSEENGALRVIPRSHLNGYIGTDEWTFALTGGPFGEPASAHVVEATPGDVLLHATALIHGSLRSDAPTLRRTVYIHFNQYEDVRLHSSDSWARKGYLPGQGRLLDAIAARRRAFHEETPFTPAVIGEGDLT